MSELITTRPEPVLTVVDGRVRMHCTGHTPHLLLGDWEAEQDWSPELADAIAAAINEHRPEHAEWAMDCE